MLLLPQSHGLPLRTSKPVPMADTQSASLRAGIQSAPFKPAFSGSLLSRPVLLQKPTTPSQFLGHLARKHLLTMTATLSTLGTSILQRLGLIPHTTRPESASWPDEPINLPNLEPEQSTPDSQSKHPTSNEPVILHVFASEEQSQDEPIPKPLQNFDAVEPVATSKQETPLSSKHSSLQLAETATSEDVEEILPKTPDNQSEPNSLSSSVEWVERPAMARQNDPQDLEAGWAMVDTLPQPEDRTVSPKPLPNKTFSRSQRITHFILKRDNSARL